MSKVLRFKLGELVKIKAEGFDKEYAYARISSYYTGDGWDYWTNLLYSGERIPFRDNELSPFKGGEALKIKAR